MTPEFVDPAEQVKAARQHVRQAFLDAVGQGEEVRQIREKMVEHARKNNFGPGLEKAMQAWRNRQ